MNNNTRRIFEFPAAEGKGILWFTRRLSIWLSVCHFLLNSWSCSTRFRKAVFGSHHTIYGKKKRAEYFKTEHQIKGGQFYIFTSQNVVIFSSILRSWSWKVILQLVVLTVDVYFTASRIQTENRQVQRHQLFVIFLGILLQPNCLVSLTPHYLHFKSISKFQNYLI